MPGFLQVNRNCVQTALIWLKENNPLYFDIVISSDRLNELPLNGIPVEIITVAKHSDNTTLLALESEGYIPKDVWTLIMKVCTCPWNPNFVDSKNR